MSDATTPNKPLPAGDRRRKGMITMIGVAMLITGATLLAQVGTPALPFKKAHEASRGRLSFQLFAIESLPTGTGEQVKAVVPRHLEYLEQLEKPDGWPKTIPCTWRAPAGS